MLTRRMDAELSDLGHRVSAVGVGCRRRVVCVSAVAGRGVRPLDQCLAAPVAIDLAACDQALNAIVVRWSHPVPGVISRPPEFVY